MVIAKPIQFTMVSAVPLTSKEAFCATSVEKSGESAITTMPQKIRKLIKTNGESILNKIGENKQQQQERSNAIKAIFLVP